MPGKVVLDASVIAAISFIRDGESERAANAIEDKDLITVDLAIAEVGIVAWKRSFIFKRIESGHLSRFRKASGSSWKHVRSSR